MAGIRFGEIIDVRIDRSWIVALLLSVALVRGATVSDYAIKVAPLIDPAKLATLGERGANPRVQKVVYWLATAQAEKVNVTNVVRQAMSSVAIINKSQRKLTADALLRNLVFANQLGALDAAGLEEMRRGNAATVRRGPYAGDQLSVDHIIPRKVVPELDNVIANLELMPGRMNSKKNASMGTRQRDLALKFHKAGLLSPEGLRAALGTKNPAK